MIHLSTKTIIIPTDFSETSLLAIKHGAFLAQYTKGDVYLVHVIAKHWEKYNVFASNVTEENLSNALDIVQEKLSELADDIKKNHGIDVKTSVITGNPTTELVAFAKEVEASLIVMGTHGYSAWEDLTIGSNALKVITKSTCPVMTMSQHANSFGYHNIVLPIDTSEHTRQKVPFVLELAKLFTAKIHAVGILAGDEGSKKPATEVILHQIATMAHDRGIMCDTALLEDVKNRAVATVQYSEKVNGDLVAIMTDLDAEISGFFFGNYALQVIHHSKVPVISIKPEEHPENINFSILAGT